MSNIFSYGKYYAPQIPFKQYLGGTPHKLFSELPDQKVFAQGTSDPSVRVMVCDPIHAGVCRETLVPQSYANDFPDQVWPTGSNCNGACQVG